MDNFDLRKYLVENKVTTNSKMSVVENEFKTGKEYIKAAARDNYQIDLDSPNAEKSIKELDINPADIVMWMVGNDPKVGSIEEYDFAEYLDDNNLKYEVVAEYQYKEQSYDFISNQGANEYDSALEIGRVVTQDGKPVKIEGYDFVVGTDRGAIGSTYALMNTAHVKVLKSIADIFNVDVGWYIGYKGRTKN